ncbi:MAG: ABC transporter permease subunit [Clostridia bacterium]
MKKHLNPSQYFLIAAVYLAIWGGISLLIGKELLLPSPWATIGRFFALLTRWESWRLAGLTLTRIMAGYVLGVAAGVFLAIICARFSFACALLSPLKSIVKATPVTSFILLALLWFPSGMVPLFIAFLMVLPIVWTNVLEGILHTDGQLLEMAYVYRFGWIKTWRTIYVPSALPQFLAACTTALGFAWKSGVAAEIIALPKASVGYQLYQSKLNLETVDLFAWTLLVILLSMLLEWLLVSLMRRIRHD